MDKPRRKERKPVSKTPEVITFVEPGKRTRETEERPARDVRSKTRGTSKGRRAEEGDDERQRRREFVSARKDVLELGASSFEGRDRRIWEAKRLAALGADTKLLKPKHKMPLKMLLGVLSKQRHMEKVRLRKESESGVVTGRKASDRLVHGARRSKAEDMAKRRRKEARAGGVRDLEDRVKGGVMRIRNRRGHK